MECTEPLALADLRKHRLLVALKGCILHVGNLYTKIKK
jgi:hypothetical protein